MIAWAMFYRGVYSQLVRLMPAEHAAQFAQAIVANEWHFHQEVKEICKQNGWDFTEVMKGKS
jgi:hypothetical protein